MLLLLLFAAHASAESGQSPSAAPLEASTTGYWSRSHDIPDFNTTVSAAIASTDTTSATRRFERVMDSLGANRIQLDRRFLSEAAPSVSWPAAGQAVWELPKSKQESLLAALRKRAGCNYVRVRDTPSPHEELSSKRDGLLQEANSHFEITASTVVRSFLEAELQTLNRLLWLDKVASANIGLFITIAPPGRSPPYVDAPILHLRPPQTIFAANDPALGEVHLSSASNPFPFAFWNRTSPSGEARTEATIVVDMTGDPKYHTQDFGEEVPKKVARFGASGYSSASEFLKFPGWEKYDTKWPPLYFTIPRKKLDSLRDGLAPGSKLLYWSQSDESAAAFASAARKRELLSAERLRLDQPLKSAPLTRALIDAELERLKPFAEKSVAQAGTAVVRIILAIRRTP